MSQLPRKRFAPENIKRTALTGYTVREQPRQSFQKHSVHKGEYGNGSGAIFRKYRRRAVLLSRTIRPDRGSAPSFIRNRIRQLTQMGNGSKRNPGNSPTLPPRTSRQRQLSEKREFPTISEAGSPIAIFGKENRHSCVRTVILSKKALSAPFCLNFIPVCQTRAGSSSQKMNFELISL